MVKPQVIRAGAWLLMTGLLVDAVTKTATAWQNPGGTDFLSTFAAVRASRDGACLYCPGDEVAYQAGLLNAHPAGLPQLFVYAPIFPWLLRPIASLDFRSAAIVVSAMQIAFLLAALHQLRKVQSGRAAMFAVVAAVLSLPANWDLRLMQWDGVLLFALAMGLRDVASGRQARAGMWLGVLLLKPQLVWLVPFFVIRKPRILAGFAGAGVIWLASSVLFGGFGSTQQFIKTATQPLNTLTTSGGIMTLLQAPFGNSVMTASALAIAVVIVGAAWYRRAWFKSHVDVAIAVGVVASMFASPHLNIYDLVLLAAPIAVLAKQRPNAAVAIAVTLSIVEFVEERLFTGAAGLGPGPHLSSWVAIAIAPLLLGLQMPLSRHADAVTP